MICDVRFNPFCHEALRKVLATVSGFILLRWVFKSSLFFFSLRPGDLLHRCETLERHSVCSQPELAFASEGRGPKRNQYLHWADWGSPQSYHGKTKFSCNVQMPSWKPKCQTVWHTCVQGPTNCPGQCFHPNSSRVKRFWVTTTIYMEISNTTARLPKLPKWSSSFERL